METCVIIAFNTVNWSGTGYYVHNLNSYQFLIELFHKKRIYLLPHNSPHIVKNVARADAVIAFLFIS